MYCTLKACKLVKKSYKLIFLPGRVKMTKNGRKKCNRVAVRCRHVPKSRTTYLQSQPLKYPQLTTF